MMRSKKKRLARKPPFKIYTAKDVKFTFDGIEHDFSEINYSEKMGTERREPMPSTYEMTITLTQTRPHSTATDACGACGGLWDDAHKTLQACPDANPNRLAP